MTPTHKHITYNVSRKNSENKRFPPGCSAPRNARRVHYSLTTKKNRSILIQFWSWACADFGEFWDEWHAPPQSVLHVGWHRPPNKALILPVIVPRSRPLSLSPLSPVHEFTIPSSIWDNFLSSGIVNSLNTQKDCLPFNTWEKWVIGGDIGVYLHVPRSRPDNALSVPTTMSLVTLPVDNSNIHGTVLEYPQ